MNTLTLPRGVSRLLGGAGFALAVALAGPGLAEGENLADAQRIVAIGGSVTEIVYALGEEGRLVARDTTSGYPEAATKLPDVGYMRALAPEGVLSVKPDAILTLEGSGPPETLTVLKAAGVPYVTVPERYDDKGILDKIDIVGKALGVEEKAGELAGRVKADLGSAMEEASARGRDARILFILSMNGGRILASGSGTAADGILAMAGAQNAFPGFAGYKQLNDEAVISAAPDAILMISRGEGHAAPIDDVLSHPAIAQTPAGVNKRLIRMDGLYLLGFGPRTGAAVRDLSAALAEHGL